MSVITITRSASIAERGQHLQLVRRWLRQDGVERHDERLRQLPRERQDVLAVGAAEDPEFVLEQDNVDVQPAEQPRRPHVVPSRLLGNRREEVWRFRARQVIDDRDLVDPVYPGYLEQRGADVCCKCADSACTWRIRGDNRAMHVPWPVER